MPKTGNEPSGVEGVSDRSSGPTTRLDAHTMSAVLARYLRVPVIDSFHETVVFYDLSRLENVLARLRAAFPPNTLHAVAVKANPTVEILKRIRAAGHGCEVASIGELHLAIAAGFPVESIVFDSPVKTREELEFALKIGVGINANVITELERIDRLYTAIQSRSRVGIRINPEIGSGSIPATSVAVRNSKFGVPLEQCRAELRQAFLDYEWLTGIHVHIGSQGMSREQLLDGVGAVYDFMVEIEERAGIRVFNIGGGLPAKYRETEDPLGFEDYAGALRHRCPHLFDLQVSLVSEFGRAIHANCGWVASRVEYRVENREAIPTLLVHVGADMFLRKAYRPDDWHHDLSVCDSNGHLRTGRLRTFQVAGPLCFAGDFIDRRASMPEDVQEGDYVLIHDAGAYTFSMWSLYNSRQFPAIIGYEDGGERFCKVRNLQTVDEIVRFWS